VAEVAASHSVSWPTAHRAFITHAEALLSEPEPTPVLGIDETRRGKPRWERCEQTRRWVRVDPWDTGFVDLAGDQGLLGQREGRSGAAVVDWLSARSDEFREAVQFVAIDPAAVYAAAIRTPALLPNATLVVDHFHLVKLANDALTKVRRRVTWELRDRRGRKLDPEWANRRRLLRAREHLSDKSFTKMWNAIVSEDDTGQILSAWIAKEELRTLLSTVRVGGDAHLTRHRLHRFPVLVHRLPNPRAADPGRHRRHLVARNQRLHRHRHHQRAYRGLQPARQTGQTRRLRVPQPRQLGPPDTIPLHPQTAGRNPDRMLIARSKSKSR
jgi:transposase